MGRAVLLFLIIASLLFVEPVSVLPVFELSAKTTTEITKTLFATFEHVSDVANKEKLLCSSLDTITVQIGNISQSKKLIFSHFVQ